MMQTQQTLQTRYLEVSGGRIAYDDSGSEGPLVICVPGLGDVRASYRFFAPQLVEAGYRVVTMDMRGHGESSTGWSDYRDTSIAEDVLALIHALNAGPAILAGNSYGGAAVTYAAAKEPQSVAGLILLDAFVHDLPQNFVQRLGVWAVARIGAGAWVSYYKSLYTGTKPADFEEYCTALKANLSEQGRYAAVRAMMYGSHATVEAHLAEVHAPTLIVVGAKDPDFSNPSAEAQFIAGKLSNATSTEIQLIEGAGHYPHAEMPERVQLAVIPFLQRLREGARNDA